MDSRLEKVSSALETDNVPMYEETPEPEQDSIDSIELIEENEINVNIENLPNKEVNESAFSP